MTRLASVSCFVGACLVLVASANVALAGDWTVVADADRTSVRFVSKATVESFEGRTGAVAGWIGTTSGAGADSIAWRISIDLASLDTGIGLRNTHMRENHLHTDEHPEAVFAGAMAWPAGAALPEPGVPVDVDLAGQLDLHGVTRPRSIPVRMTLAPDGSLEARAEFSISLADHDIPRPKFLLLKLADVQQVEVRILARPEKGDR